MDILRMKEYAKNAKNLASHNAWKKIVALLNKVAMKVHLYHISMMVIVHASVEKVNSITVMDVNPA
jgi:hypothetical protein